FYFLSLVYSLRPPSFLHDALPISRGPWHPLLAREPSRRGCPFSWPPLPAASDSPDSRGPCSSLRILAAEAETPALERAAANLRQDRKSTRLNSSHLGISYAVFCLK